MSNSEQPLVSAELEAAIRDGGKEAFAELMWYAIQQRDIETVSKLTQIINGLRNKHAN